MLTQEQLDERSGYLGASEAAAVLGLDPHRQAMDVWLEKTGRVPPVDLSDRECVEAGNVLEPAIRAWAAQRLGRRIDRVNRTIYHKEARHIACHPDGRIVGSMQGVEIKNRSVFMRSRYGEAGTDEVMDTDLVQCQHVMACTRWDVMHMPVVFGGQRLVLFRVVRDEEFIADMLAAEDAFWSYIVSDEMPPIDWQHERVGELVRRLYPGTDGSVVALPQEALGLHKELVELKASAKELAGELDRTRARLQFLMGSAAVGVLPGGEGCYRRKLIPIKEKAPREYTRDDFRFSDKVPE